MNEVLERLRAGESEDERTIPARAKYRDESRHVRFDECDRSGRMRTASVMRHAQDLAWIHSDALQFSREWYAARGVGWVVRAIDLIVDDLPGPSARLVGTTALVGFRHVMARRRTRLSVDGGRIVADAAIDWVMIDDAGRPARFPSEFEDFVAEVGATFTPTKIHAEGTEGDALQRVAVPLRVADIDPLGHVNNAAWLEIVDEAIAISFPELLSAPRRRIRLEYLGVADAPSVTVSLRGDAGAVRIDAADPNGLPLLRGRVEAVPHSRHEGA